MSGICSRHQHHEIGCKLCEAIPPSISNVLLSQGVLYSGMAKIVARLEIAVKALTEISEMRYRTGGETEEAEIARRAIENMEVYMPGVDRECVTHHHACDCREARFRDLINAFDKYIAFLDKANQSPIMLAHVHGWRCPQADIFIGETMRKEIERLRHDFGVPEPTCS